MRLDIWLSDLDEEESHCLLPISESEEGGEVPETQGVFTTHREPLTSPPSVTTQGGQSTNRPDEPEVMNTQTREVEEEIIIRTESLHINDQPNRVDEERINPNTGHMEPEDATAINRAAGPDRPDPPSERAFPHHGGGGGGGGQPVGWGALPPAPPQQADNRLYGVPPDTFLGNRAKVKDFITQWE